MLINFGAICMLSVMIIRLLLVLSLASGDIPVTSRRKAQGTGSVYQVMKLQSSTFTGFLTDKSHCITVKYVQNAISSVTAKGIFEHMN